MVQVRDHGSWRSPIAKYVPEAAQLKINDRLAAKNGDLIIFGIGALSTVVRFNIYIYIYIYICVCVCVCV